MISGMSLTPEQMQTNRKTSHVTACLASSLDGKIAPSGVQGYIRLGTDEDIRHLQALRDDVSAVIYGGETFRAYPRPHRGLNRGDTPLHVIMSKSVNLPPDATFFLNSPPVPTLIASPQTISDEVKAQYPSHVLWFTTNADQPIASLLAYLRQIGHSQLLLEGGGEIIQLFLAERAIDELYLTLCPLIIGGKDSPSVSGFDTPFHQLGFPLPGINANLKSIKRNGSELFLRYQLHYESTT